MSASNDSPLLVTSAKANLSATFKESWKKETTFWVIPIRKGETLKILAFFSLNFSHKDMTSLENYIKEYYQQILKRLREMEADLNIEEKKRLPF